MKNLLYILLLLLPFQIMADLMVGNLNNNEIWDKKNDGEITIYTEKNQNRIPVLCFHIIGDEPRYEITLENFENLIKYLVENKFYPISDKDFINRDFSLVPTGYKPIVLGSDDASEGNFLYKTKTLDSLNGELNLINGSPVLEENTMVSILENNLTKSKGRYNFTFYTSFNGVPFRQTGGQTPTGEYSRGLDVLGSKFNYLLDNFFLGIHTVTHPVTKETSAKDFKWEIDEFYNILESYVGDRINLINTIAYPYGCAILSPEMKKMLENYSYKGVKLIGGFDFDGYFTNSPFSNKLYNYDISRLGVDNQNIEQVYGFLENIKLFESKRAIVVKKKSDLDNISYNENDTIIVGEL